MSKTIQDTEPTVEELLEQRKQYEDWLAKLDASGDKVPPSVRQRVRGDYEGRLQSVMQQLHSRGSAISEELERHHATQAELDRQRRAAEEELAEAEVRHAVGEYAEDEWRRLSEESRRKIEQLRNQLRGVGSEINRLTQVQGVIASPARSTPSPAPAAAPAPAPPRAQRPEVVEQAPMVTHATDPMDDDPGPSRTAPRQPAPVPAPQPAAEPSDELAFLKSVADDEPMPSRRPSNPGIAQPSVARAPEPAVQTAVPSPTKAAAAVAKTLKCSECGTLNRPTEWYCERCGAELAGV
jgi:hypothetical protein